MPPPLLRIPRVRANMGSTRNMLRALSQHEQETTISCSEWFRPRSFSRRLLDCVTFAFLMDSISFIVATASESANEFITTGAPAIVNGIVGIAPSLLPFLPQVITLCKHHDPEEHTDASEYRQELDVLFQPIFGNLTTVTDDVREQVRHEVELIKMQLVDKFIASKQTSTLTRFEAFINAVYVVIHGVGSGLMLLNGIRDLAGDDSDELQEINKWMTVGSTAAYLIYYLVCLLPKRIRYCTFVEHESVEPESPPESPQALTIAVPNHLPVTDTHAALHQSLLVSPSPK